MYNGYKVVTPNEFQLNMFYSALDVNLFDCHENEYLVINDIEGHPIDEYKWNGEKYVKLKFKDIDNAFSGRVHPRNIQQRMAFDLLQDNKTTVKVLSGRYGSGKSMIMITQALDFIQRGLFDKLIWVRNNIEVKDTTALGSLPGGELDKLLPYAGPLIDHTGGIEGFNHFLEEGKIEIQHLGFIRGRDIKHSIIMSSEAENLTREHVQLLIGRVGEGSNLWLEGDYSQVDKKAFQDSAGMRIAVNALAGDKLFGYVDMPITERSATACLADKIDAWINTQK